LIKFFPKSVRYGFAFAGLSAIVSGHCMGQTLDRPHFDIEGMVIVWAADPASNAPIVGDFILDTGNGTTAAASGDTDLIAEDMHTVVTGTLSATQDSFSGATGGIPFVLTNTDRGTINTDTNDDGKLSDEDVFTAFGLTNLSNARVDATRQSSSFYVASNVPFAIDAQAFTPSTFTEFILLLITNMQMSVTPSGDDGLSFGASAQPPHSGGGASGFAPSFRLWDLRNAQNIFTGNQRTALTNGTIADQSVRFDAEYSIGAGGLAGYDLSLGTFDFEVEIVYTVFVP
jgi:hypothetical protein